MNAADRGALLHRLQLHERFEPTVGDRTLEILEARRRLGLGRRGWLVRRALVVADLIGLTVALLLAGVLFGVGGSSQLGEAGEYLLFAASLPAWVVAARLYGLYDKDEERTDHTTVDDFFGVFQLVTVTSWLLYSTTYLAPIATPAFSKLLVFWMTAAVAIPVMRAFGRAYCRRQIQYLQNTIIVGDGEVGQLVARKFLQHPEYGIHVVGYVDTGETPAALNGSFVPRLGAPDDLAELVDMLDVERVVIAFPRQGHEETLSALRSLRGADIQIDLVPSLFDVVGPNVTMHFVEGLPLIGLPPASMSRSSRVLKRAVDLLGATALLAVSWPLFAYAAWRIPRESPGPVFFRQRRLREGMREFTVLKFRTMRADTDDAPHRAFIRQTMAAPAPLDGNVLFKLEREDTVTPFGRWLRRTSLDELPQLINVLRGEMSLVGPRPCIRYETEGFAPHHFERFLVPQGMTGLWQVTARARASFGEALDMDVSYARGWSLGLDVALLLKTPIQMIRARTTA